MRKDLKANFKKKNMIKKVKFICELINTGTYSPKNQMKTVLQSNEKHFLKKF